MGQRFQLRVFASPALEASRVVTTAAAGLHELAVYNDSSSDAYIQLYDAAAVPADGAILPTLLPSLLVKTKGTAVWSTVANPLAAGTGIVICASSVGGAKNTAAAGANFHFWGRYS